MPVFQKYIKVLKNPSKLCLEYYRFVRFVNKCNPTIKIHDACIPEKHKSICSIHTIWDSFEYFLCISGIKALSQKTNSTLFDQAFHSTFFEKSTHILLYVSKFLKFILFSFIFLLLSVRKCYRKCALCYAMGKLYPISFD